MNHIEQGLRGYRNHNISSKPVRSSHPLDILSSILFDIKSENRKREMRPDTEFENETRENFRDVLKKEISKMKDSGN